MCLYPGYIKIKSGVYKEKYPGYSYIYTRTWAYIYYVFLYTMLYQDKNIEALRVANIDGKRLCTMTVDNFKVNGTVIVAGLVTS